jgi:hypothetical protein
MAKVIYIYECNENMKSVNADLGMPASFKKINEGREVFRGVV